MEILTNYLIFKVDHQISIVFTKIMSISWRPNLFQEKGHTKYDFFCRVGLRTDQTTPKMNFYTHCCLLLASSKNMLQCNLSEDQIEFSGKICRLQFNFELKFTYIMKVPLAPLYNKSKKK